MGMFLNKTGRPIVYSCEWPLYDKAHGAPVRRLFFNKLPMSMSFDVSKKYTSE